MHFLSLASLALAISGASAIAIPRSHVQRVARHDKPDTYAEGYLEPYNTYHLRYTQLGCQNQHGTPFFDACCHPMLATETLAKNRAPECNPANHASSSAAPAQPTGGDNDEDCGDDDDEPTATASSAAPTSTDDDDDDECEGEGDEPSTSAAPSAPTSSSQAPATTHPVTTTTPSSSHSATPTKTTASPTKATSSPTPTGGSGGSGGSTFDGNATFYYQNGNAGACGKFNPDSAHIAAMQTERYGDLGKQSSLCGKQVEITNKKNGKTVVVTIADACPTCGSGNDIDLSVGAFTQIATKDEGEVPITWKFL